MLYRPLLSELAREVEGDTDYIVVDACGHWLLRNLVATKGNADRSFAELLLEAVPANQITAWTKTNRGSFVVCRYADRLEQPLSGAIYMHSNFM